MVIKMRLKIVNYRGQVTIFIILGLMLVVGFLIVFLLVNPPEVHVVDENNPEAFIESCTRESVEEAIDILSKNGGDISPKGFIQFQGNDLTYLCFSYHHYYPCINQRPRLVKHMEDEITNYIAPKIEECFDDLESRLNERYDIETSGTNIITTLQSEQVTVVIDKKFKMSREEDSRDITQFRMNLVHPIYNFAIIAMEIVNQEAHFCNFDELGHMILNPQFDIIKFVTGDSDVVYRLKDYETNQEFRFAVRSCTFPAGYV
jgi:hypothetical protein